jgi:DNA-binding response OmpR family regulator
MSTILIVDDEPGQLDILAQLLSSQDYRVQAVTSAHQALDLIHFYPPDLILLDVVLPGLDGLELCRRIKADPSACHIPIIFLSARDEVDDRLAGLEAGGVDYIVKPFHTHDVLARVAVHLRLAPPATSSVMCWCGLKIALDQWSAWIDAQEIDLSPSEFITLRELIKAQGRVVTKGQLQAATRAASRVAVKDIVRRLRRRLFRRRSRPSSRLCAGWATSSTRASTPDAPPLRRFSPPFALFLLPFPLLTAPA